MRRALPHDITNALAAAALVLETGLGRHRGRRRAALADVRAARRTASSWSARVDGVRWYNDSKATTPHAALTAIRGFDGIVLIAGGTQQGARPASLASEPDRMRGVVALGEAADEMAAAFDPAAARSASPRPWPRRSTSAARDGPAGRRRAARRPAAPASTGTPAIRPGATTSRLVLSRVPARRRGTLRETPAATDATRRMRRTAAALHDHGRIGDADRRRAGSTSGTGAGAAGGASPSARGHAARGATPDLRTPAAAPTAST